VIFKNILLVFTVYFKFLVPKSIKVVKLNCHLIAGNRRSLSSPKKIFSSNKSKIWRSSIMLHCITAKVISCAVKVIQKSRRLTTIDQNKNQQCAEHVFHYGTTRTPAATVVVPLFCVSTREPALLWSCLTSRPRAACGARSRGDIT
jgi:hypothetical protein